jgi:hypothetical protein
MRPKIKIEKYLNSSDVKTELVEMEYKIGSFVKDKYEFSNIEKRSCLMHLKSVNNTHDIYIRLPIKNIRKHSDFTNEYEFVQWWLSFIKDAICPLYNAIIYNAETTKDYITILISKVKNQNNLIGFTNYELIRYLVGLKFNIIPSVVYELVKHRRKYFENDLELFYYALYMQDIFRIKNKTGNNCNPNYTWHFCTVIEIKKNDTDNLNYFNIPLYCKPTNYGKFGSNFEHLKSTFKNLDSKLSIFDKSNSIVHNTPGFYGINYTERVKISNAFKRNQYQKYIECVKIDINNIYSFKSSLKMFKKMCYLTDIKLQNEIATA